MLYKTIVESAFSNGMAIHEEGYDCHIVQRKLRRRFMSRTHECALNVALLVKGSYDFAAVLDAVIAETRRANYDLEIAVEANWFVFSAQADATMLDSFNTKRFLRYRGMVNSFALFNTDSGMLFFHPGEIKNRVINDRLAFLMRNSFEDNATGWRSEIISLFDVVSMMLDDGKFLLSPRPIKRGE